MSRNHERLEVFHVADELVLDIYRVSKEFPVEERLVSGHLECPRGQDRLPEDLESSYARGMVFTVQGQSLTPDDVARVARAGATARVELAPTARARNMAAFARASAILAAGAHVYGHSTGVGALRSVRVDPAAHGDHQRRLLRSHAGGAGDVLSPELTRALLLVRANQLAAGGAGVDPGLLDALVAALNENRLPVLRELGSLGTGDLAQLAELGLVLLGERPPGGPPAPLGPRDGLLLMSSNAGAQAQAALSCADLAHLIEAAETCAALSFEAAEAQPAALDARVHAARPHAGQIAAAEHLRVLLGAYAPKTPRVQDSFAFRCLPQVHGVLREAHAHLDRVVRIEINAAAENPLLADGELLANGNFHAAPLATALDHVRNALAQVSSLAAARLSDLLSPAVTTLSPFLAREPGPDSGLMILEYTAQAAVAEAGTLAQPVVRSAVVSQGIENHASFAPLAARQTARAMSLFASVLATELVAAVRIFRMRADTPQGPGTKAFFERAIPMLATDMADRPLTADLDAALALLWQPLQKCEK